VTEKIIAQFLFATCSRGICKRSYISGMPHGISLPVNLLLSCTQERKGRQIAHKIYPGLSLATVSAGCCPSSQVIKGRGRFAGQWCVEERVFTDARTELRWC